MTGNFLGFCDDLIIKRALKFVSSIATCDILAGLLKQIPWNGPKKENFHEFCYT